jgi:hypothetical protein
LEVFALHKFESVVLTLNLLSELLTFEKVANIGKLLFLEIFDGLIPIGLLTLQGLYHSAFELLEVGWFAQIVLID